MTYQFTLRITTATETEAGQETRGERGKVADAVTRLLEPFVMRPIVPGTRVEAVHLSTVDGLISIGLDRA
jgi:hypothetical protein